MGHNFLNYDSHVPYIQEILKIYNKAGIGLINDQYKASKRPALLVVDLQEGFTSADSLLGTKEASFEAKQHIDKVIENTQILINTFHKKKFPVIYIITAYNKHLRDKLIKIPIVEKNPGLLNFYRSSKLAQIDRRVRPHKGDYIIEKVVPSGFIGTSLMQILVCEQVDACVIVGLSISACIRQTAVDAVSYGYYAVLPEECVGDRGIGPGKASLFDIMTKFADVSALKDVLFWIDRLSQE